MKSEDHDSPLSAGAFLEQIAAAPSIEVEHVDLIGTTIAHFRVTGRLGRGGMGVVYRAEDTKLGRTVAVKVLPPAVVGDDLRRRRFLREARVAAAVTHANIATIYEIGEHDEQIFIAMELIEGRSLRERLEEGPMEIDEALRTTHEIALAIGKAHAESIVHRDLKPDNVMLSENGAIKVLDFGLAKLSEVDASSDSLDTAEGTIVGTAGYMSPEQALGRAVDQRGDLFSMGVMLYEMCCGERPFLGDSAMEVIVATTRDAPRAPSAIRSAIGPALEAVIMRCLEKEPDDRFANVAAFLAALDRVSEAEPPPWGRWALGLGAVLAIGTVAVWMAGREPSPREQLERAAPTTAPTGTTSASVATVEPLPVEPSASAAPLARPTPHGGPPTARRPNPPATPAPSSSVNLGF